MIPEVKQKAAQRMDKAMEALKREFATVRTGRASLSLLDGIRVEYYGTQVPLNQVATLAIPESRLITIQPWDTSVIGEIEKAILKSDLGLTPSNDGKTIRIAIPPLTEERRRELVKVVRKMAEDARIAVRNARREANEALKKLEKSEHLSQDEVRKAMEDVQKTTDQHIRQVDELLARKEAEIMEV